MKSTESPNPPIEKHVLWEFRRLGEPTTPTAMESGRDLWWHDLVEDGTVSASLTDTDRESIMELALKSGFEKKDDGDTEELAASPKAFWTFVEALLAQRS